mgnify:CR=1 FL=1
MVNFSLSHRKGADCWNTDVGSLLFLVIVTILLALPASYEPHHFAKTLFVGALGQSFAYACVLALLTLWSKSLRRIVFTIVFVLFCVESFLFFRFGSRFDPNMLTMMLQTSWRESTEFFAVYILSLRSLLFLCGAAVLFILLQRCMESPRLTRPVRIGKVQALMGVGLFAVCAALPLIPLPFPLGKNTVNQLAMSVGFVTERHAEVEKMANMIDQIVVSKSPAEPAAPVIVLVIGESFNKQHSSLYGYALRTSPILERELEAGRLLRYTKAISPTNGTDFAMRFIFTLKGCEHADSTDRRQYVLFPAVFKKAGYYVAYFDNQYTRSTGGSLDYSCGYFLNPTYINEHCFDRRNAEITAYDGDFVDRYREEFSKKHKSLNIIHLMGQHFDARLRFPAPAFARFDRDSIHRADLSDSERQQVADYDNATLYNDYVMGKIIDTFRDTEAVIVYLSDHGEQVYEGPQRYFGRGFGSTDDEVTLKSIYEVPFMVWCSDSFISKHADKYAALKHSTPEPLCTADVAFLLFDLADIDFNYNVKQKSFIDAGYRQHEVKF